MIVSEDAFFKLISARHSVRAFKEEKLADKIIEKILLAASKAPSARNLQSYYIFVVTKKEDKKRLVDATTFEQRFIENASIVLVFCADQRTIANELGNRGKELFCIQDATISCTYAQLAAHVLGLESVWIGAFDEEKVRKSLFIKSGLKPVVMLVIGISNENPEITSRKTIDEISLKV